MLAIKISLYYLEDDYFNTDCEKGSTLFHMNVDALMVL